MGLVSGNLFAYFMNDTPKTSEAAGTPTKNWESVAERLFECSRALEHENNRYRETLHDGYAVYSQLTEAEKKFTSADNVSAVLDAFKRVLLANKTAQPCR